MPVIASFSFSLNIVNQEIFFLLPCKLLMSLDWKSRIQFIGDNVRESHLYGLMLQFKKF